eukprot:CAMPEP_0185616682 /NCGR_PEP_ID=MMETSP0436-20130131/40679_1 /TAXON_ID=626734 ORGANISM="Favella taraikaensis, Strain Fe Narragansett Bay" /NCGR_SAMPLE_ID=MMETSP0436 /ASSEMBLY_ACC=CAM_ASM_000390 /LENGTH=72 /DNA_ID=CAMNT_0028253597 /DNA_START=44 /DNA_END=262 /DNA_ORIENTATION=-
MAEAQRREIYLGPTSSHLESDEPQPSVGGWLGATQLDGGALNINRVGHMHQPPTIRNPQMLQTGKAEQMSSN